MSLSAALPRLFAAPAGASDRPIWSLDGRDWPLRRHSLFTDAAGVRWHVQQYGEGPDLLLLHGAAAATHSWRDLGPLLAERFRITALDMPGHGFSGAPARQDAFTQRGMAAAVGALLAQLGVEPDVIVGHSAGAALGAALALTGAASPRGLVALNGALQPHHAFSGSLFPALAKAASLAPAAQLFAWRASTAHVEQVIRGTGSDLDPLGVELYRRLFARRGHVSAAFAMMAGWQARSVLGELHSLGCPLALIAAEGDRAIPPAQSDAVARRVRMAEVMRTPGGHLAHEEHPGQVADLIFRAIAQFPPNDGTPA